MPPVFIKREIRPLQYELEVQRNPFKPDDPNAKVLIILLPLDQESLVFTLSEDQQTRLHDATAPSDLRVYGPGDVPKPS